jgi:carboxylesterase
MVHIHTMPNQPTRFPRVLILGLAFIAACATAFAILSAPPPLPSLPAPALSFSQATDRIARLQSADSADVRPECRTHFVSQGRPTPYALVYFHGFGNCPHQADPILKLAADRGWNVFAPRMPRNGLNHPRHPSLSQLTAEELTTYATESGQIASALGQRVIVAGLSVGGALAAWTAERFPFHRAVIIAPCFGLSNLGRAGSHWLMRAALLLPDRFIDYAPGPDGRIGPPHSYSGFSTRAIAQALRFAETALDAPSPSTRDLRLILNASDTAVDESSSRDLARRWLDQGVTVTQIVIPQRHNLIHDLIDPLQPQQNIATAYPYVLPHLEP